MRSRAFVKRGVERRVVHETAERFHSEVVERFVQQEIAKKQWIYKVIDGEQEADAVLLDTDDFMLLPDRDAVNEGGVVNWLVIFKDTGLLSTRYLRGEHLPLLRTVKAAVLERLDKDCHPMLYFHHPPSVWQLHLHVAAPCDILRTTNDMQKVVFLEDVMSNLEIDSEYYRKATVTYTLPVGHELIKALVDAGDID